MSSQRHGLLTIGGFANASQLSLKALRLYDQLGILKPCYVDGESGYRYYHVDQLQEARLIRIMRQMDMPLATIRQVLAATPTDAERLVREYWHVQEKRMEQARLMVHDLVALLRQEATAMTLEVSVKKVEAQPIISITDRVKVDQLGNHIRRSLTMLYTFAEEQGHTVVGPPFGIYHGPVNNDDDGPMEVCVPVSSTIVATGTVRGRTLAGGTVAYVLLRGDQCTFPAILAGYDTVYDWIRQNGYEAVEAPREIWHIQPSADEQIEEIAWLFRESKSG